MSLFNYNMFYWCSKRDFCDFLIHCICFFAALFLIIVKRKKKDYEMPLVPFVLAAYLFSLFENIA